MSITCRGYTFRRGHPPSGPYVSRNPTPIRPPDFPPTQRALSVQKIENYALLALFAVWILLRVSGA